jgi:hypothetical protein
MLIGSFSILNIQHWGLRKVGSYYLVCSPDQYESTLCWKTSDTSTSNTDSSTNGKANTAAMVSVGISLHPAGQYCVNYTAGGYNDWYLPSYSELSDLFDQRTVLENAGADNFISGYYWSSTQNDTQRAYIVTLSGNVYSRSKSAYSYYVRPIRREAV